MQAAVWDYDAIVLDVMLPRRDGFEVCRVLRERGCWAPVLMLTARGQVSDRIEVMRLGANVASLKSSEVTGEQVVNAMVGGNESVNLAG